MPNDNMFGMLAFGCQKVKSNLKIKRNLYFIDGFSVYC